MLDSCKNSVFLPFGSCWIEDVDHGVHDKSKLVSIIASNKNITIGHKLRHAIIATDKKLDLFGRG